MASLDITTTSHEQDPPAIVREATAPRPRGEGAADKEAENKDEEEEEEENLENAPGDIDTGTATTTPYDPHEYQNPHPDANTDKDTTDKHKKAIVVKYWCGNCEKELAPKKAKTCSGCKGIKYCSEECQKVGETGPS